MTIGVVTGVTTDWRGDTLREPTTAISILLLVESIVDFDEDGGWLVVGDSDPIEYTRVDELSGGELNVVTLASTVGAVYEAGIPVQLWDPTVGLRGGKVVEYVATVELDDGSGSPDAVLPHELIPLSGVTALEGAKVSITRNDSDDVVVERVLGRDAALIAEVLALNLTGLGARITQHTEDGRFLYQLGDLTPFMGEDTIEDGSYLYMSHDGDPDTSGFAVSVVMPSAEYPDGFATFKFGADRADDTAAFFSRVQVWNNSLTASDLVSLGGIEASFLPTTSDAANLNVNPANGNFRRVTSSERYKQDIEPVTIDPAAVLRLAVESWRDRAEVEADPGTSRRYVGVTAEKVDALGLTEFVTYDEQGRPDAVAYDRMFAALLPVAQNQESRIQRLEQQVAELLAAR